MRRSARIGWLLVGDERVASSRLQGYLIHRELTSRGVRSRILNEPGPFDTRLHWKTPRRWWEAVAHRQDVVIFQKVESSRAVRFARTARSMGTRVIFVQADYRDSPIYPLADRVIVSSEELARQLGNLCRTPITVIEDPVDLPRDLESAPSDRRRGLRLLWIGSKQNLDALAGLRISLQDRRLADVTLTTVSDHPGASISWSPAAVRAALLDADVAVIPCLDTPAALAKSNNRLSMFMAAGLPVVASPIPAYADIVEPGRTGLLARTSDDWIHALETLRDPALRRAIGAEARRAAWERYAPPEIASRWLNVIAELLAAGRVPASVNSMSKSLPP